MYAECVQGLSEQTPILDLGYGDVSKLAPTVYGLGRGEVLVSDVGIRLENAHQNL